MESDSLAFTSELPRNSNNNNNDNNNAHAITESIGWTVASNESESFTNDVELKLSYWTHIQKMPPWKISDVQCFVNSSTTNSMNRPLIVLI